MHFFLSSYIVVKSGTCAMFCPVLQAQTPGQETVYLPITFDIEKFFFLDPRALESHPYYRLPLGHSGAELPVFDYVAACAAPSETARLSEMLRVMRPLLAKEILNEEEMKALYNCANPLVACSSKWSSSDFSNLTAYGALTLLPYRLLVADAVWVICKILGPSVMKQDAWWDIFMERLAAPHHLEAYRVRPSSSHQRSLVQKFLQALDTYRKGQRPEASLLVELKQKIFLMPCIYTKFQQPVWQAWRDDDEKFKKET